LLHPTGVRLGDARLRRAQVIENRQLCREHFLMTVHVEELPQAAPGQFVHLCPVFSQAEHYRTWTWDQMGAPGASSLSPMLRRAFSIAGWRDRVSGIELDVIYRVVGKGTRWMSTLGEGDFVDLLGPLGNRFPIDSKKRDAWLVAGGVGLPPMLWLAEALHKAGKRSIAFCGAQSADLLALTLDPEHAPDETACRATMSAREFARNSTLVVLSTDDGSLGFAGHIGAALSAFARSSEWRADDLVVYTCGPERMMRYVAAFCGDRGIECYVCMERAMACGTGMCQSCVVPVIDEGDAAGWRYQLCCTDGPIFEARRILWEPVNG
jgi:dihydroorotate dehydrogenase electron transfer subunit